MATEHHIQDSLDNMGIEAEVVQQLDPDPNPSDREAPTEDEDVDFRKERIQRIETHHPDHGQYETEVNTYLLTDGSMIQETVKHRLQCPTCSNVLEDPEKNETIHPRRCGLDDCTIYRCPNCEGICASCDTPLCPRHSTGHGTKDETYCFECVGDIEEQVRHQRQIERRKQELQDRKEDRQLRQQKWNERKQAKELLLKAYKTREQLKENPNNGNPFQQARETFNNRKQQHSNAIQEIRSKFHKREQKQKK